MCNSLVHAMYSSQVNVLVLYTCYESYHLFAFHNDSLGYYWNKNFGNRLQVLARNCALQVTHCQHNNKRLYYILHRCASVFQTIQLQVCLYVMSKYFDIVWPWTLWCAFNSFQSPLWTLEPATTDFKKTRGTKSHCGLKVFPSS